MLPVRVHHRSVIIDGHAIRRTKFAPSLDLMKRRPQAPTRDAQPRSDRVCRVSGAAPDNARHNLHPERLIGCPKVADAAIAGGHVSFPASAAGATVESPVG